MDTVWYNWPVIEGDMFTTAQCVNTYIRFWITHHRRKDPVCFTAAIFSRMPAYWCTKFDLALDVKLGARNIQDMHIYAKLHYMSTRKIRVLELMCLTQFLPGAHHVMLDDKHGLRQKAMLHFLDEDKARNFRRMRAGWHQLVQEWKARNKHAEL